jgi:DNA polymerase V
MKVVDGYNRTANHGKIFMAAEGAHQPWYMKQAHRSKRFTTRWDEILKIAI